jgi:hypothetical protein
MTDKTYVLRTGPNHPGQVLYVIPRGSRISGFDDLDTDRTLAEKFSTHAAAMRRAKKFSESYCLFAERAS